MPVPVDIRGLLQRLGPGGMPGGGIPGQPPGPTQPQFQPPPAYANLQNMGGQYSDLARLLGQGLPINGGFLGNLMGGGMGGIGGLLGGHMQIPTPVNRMQAQGFPMGLLGYGGK